MKRISGFAVVGLCAALAATDCGGSGSSGGAPKNLTISGTLATGSVPTAAEVLESTSIRTESLSGFQLYCVTLANPPVAGSATAGATGAVTLTFAALNVPFGCFILNSGSAGVATLFFENGTSSGQTVSFGGDADLGTITFDQSSGLATATIPQGGSLATTPSHAACPVGTWNVVIGSYTCDSSCTNGCTLGATMTGTSTLWIAETSTGHYTASFTHIGCQSSSLANVPATWDGTTFSFGPFSSQSSDCSGQTIISAATPNGDCSSASSTSTWNMCESCGSGDNLCQGCGAASSTCTGSPVSVTRQ